MSQRAWIYVLGVILVGVVLSGLALSSLAPSTAQWLTFAVLTVLATVAQFLEAEAPSRQSYYPHLVFFFAAVLLLHPFLFVLLVVIPHLVEWAKKRLEDSPLLRDWYIQPFNIATHVIAGSAARWVYTALNGEAVAFLTLSSVLAVTAAAFIYVVLNHCIVGLVLVLARGVSWRESGVLDIENLLSDLIMLLLGAIVAVLWRLNPWLIIPALSPLVMMHRALMIPRLKQEAQTDSKTGLWNARHFVKLFTAEMERARRFDRPLALIMADIDLLRNINNTYGHLAGDVVLAGIAEIIRQNIREYDIAGRFGGEEFTIVLPEAELAKARSLAERLRQAVEATGFEVKTSSTPIQATMSFGVACFPEDATTPTDLIHVADVAVYQAKLKGRNCFVCASDISHLVGPDSAAISVEDRLMELGGDGGRPDVYSPATPVKSEAPASVRPHHQTGESDHTTRLGSVPEKSTPYGNRQAHVLRNFLNFLVRKLSSTLPIHT
jgi:diguanylate cyclase (GGDEF)-like protein